MHNKLCASTQTIQHETPSMIRTNHMNKLYELITCMKYMLSLRFTALAVIFKNEWLGGAPISRNHDSHKSFI